MMYYLILFLCNLFTYLIICQFLNDAFGKDDRKPDLIRMALGLIWYVGTIAISELFHIPILNFTTNYILTLLVSFGYKGIWLKKVLFTLMISVLSSACDLAAYYIMMSGIREEYIYSVSYIATVVLFWISERVISKLLFRDRMISIKINESIVLFIIPLCSLVLLYCVTRSGIASEYLFETGICVLIICLVMFYIYHFFLNHIENEYKNRLLEEIISGYKKELNLIKKSELKVEGMRHDLKNHLLELKALSEKGQYNKLSSYIEDMYNDLPNGKKYSKTGSYELDSLINYLIEEDGRGLKDVNVKITVPESIEINNYKLNIIIGNLLQNAIEAALKSEEKRLSLIIKMVNNILLINIENSFSNMINFDGEEIISTKTGIGKHGIGLKNVKRIVEEQRGMMDIIAKDNSFTVKVLIYL